MAINKIEKMVIKDCKNAKDASVKLLDAKASSINSALKKMVQLLKANSEMLKKENEKDLALARKKGLSSAMIDRLTLSDSVLNSMATGLKEVAALKSPLGKKFDERIRPNGLKIYKTKVPVGVIGIIYESRPNVTVDAAAICLKSQNAVILRGGSESFHSNVALAKLFSRALSESDLPKDAVTLINTTDRTAIDHLVVQSKTVDLIIPRGGEGLIEAVVKKSHIPVIKHYKGVCHIYVSHTACMKKSVPIIINSKVQRPGVCNALETLVINKNLRKDKQEKIINSLLKEGVEIFGDENIIKLDLMKKVKKATSKDWDKEYLDLKLAVKTVDTLDEAIEHINRYSSGHTESIMTQTKSEANKFLKLIDSSSVMVNASTRFADGGEYGMGCEIGISTDKLHARGPMGVDDLTTYKWIVEGNGQIR